MPYMVGGLLQAPKVEPEQVLGEPYGPFGFTGSRRRCRQEAWRHDSQPEQFAARAECDASFTRHLVSGDTLGHCPVTHLVECHLDFVEWVIKVGDTQTRGTLAKPKVRAAVRDKGGSANAVAKRAVRRFVCVTQLFEDSPRVGGQGLG